MAKGHLGIFICALSAVNKSNIMRTPRMECINSLAGMPKACSCLIDS
jgi:hypothetical protein